MGTVLVVLAVLTADGGVPSPQGRPAVDAEARRELLRAFRAAALDEARGALERARAAALGRVDLGYDLACLEARAGRIDVGALRLDLD
jgi:hypothetical protein